jgi:hypothetical protein
MLNPVEACVLNFWGDKLVHSAACDVCDKHTRSSQATEVLLQRAEHKPDTALSYPLISLRLLYLKRVCLAFFIINEKILEQQIKKPY